MPDKDNRPLKVRVSREDAAYLKELAEELKTELGWLRGRVNGSDAIAYLIKQEKLRRNEHYRTPS